MSAALLMPSFPALSEEYLLTDDDFRYIADYIYAQARIVLKYEKRPMVYSRLARRLRNLKLTKFSDYIRYTASPSGKDEAQEMLNALTTNLTSFYRESYHFDHFIKTVLQNFRLKLRDQKAGQLRIWSAGCSSGQEPYSIAMKIKDYLSDDEAQRVSIDASDIDTNIIQIAKAGIYDAYGAKGLPLVYQQKFCEKTPDGQVRIGEEIRRMIHFFPLNLHGPWPMNGQYDVIFCRNVVIYFDKETQKVLFNRFADRLHDQSWLYIGHSESLFGVSERFKLNGSTIYQKIQ